MQSNKNKKLAAFTLAEVLITLAIIGIVAALTIPTVVHKYQQKAYYTAFMKMYNTIETALQLSIAENGMPNTWSIGNDERAVLEKYIFPYLKITNICDSSEGNDCSLPYDYYTVSSEFGGDTNDIEFDDNVILLADGSFIYFVLSPSTNDIVVNFDTNGSKGPNTIGRDMFFLTYQIVDGKLKLKTDEDSSPDNCNPSSSQLLERIGTGCAIKLLQEGKMNY